MSKAVYAGTFDPLTLGHWSVAQRAAHAFDKLVIVVAGNPKKAPLFTVAERVKTIEEAIAFPDGMVGDNISVMVLPERRLLVEFANEIGATALVRGLRAVSDFEVELAMASMNKKLCPRMETVLIPPADDLYFVSSTIVKEVASIGGDVSSMVPRNVLEALKQKFPRKG